MAESPSNICTRFQNCFRPGVAMHLPLSSFLNRNVNCIYSALYPQQSMFSGGGNRWFTFAQMLSPVRLSATSWMVASQASLSMGFSRQEYWRGLPHSPPDLPNAGINTASLASPALAGGVFTTSATWKWKSFSRVRLFVTPCSIVHVILQARILEWVAVPFFRRSLQPRDRMQVSCIAGRFFTIWATRDSQCHLGSLKFTFRAHHFLHQQKPICVPYRKGHKIPNFDPNAVIVWALWNALL